MNNKLLPKYLKNTVLEFLEDIEEHVARGAEIELIKIAKAFFEAISDNQLMDIFITEVLPKKQEIMERNNNFLLHGMKSVFFKITKMQLPLEITEERFTKEDKQNIWKFFDVMIAIVEKYKKNP